MSNVLLLDWQEIEDCCKELCKIIRSSKFEVDVIVGVQRGGCIPGVIISHLLNVEEFYTIGIRTTSSESIRAVRYDYPILRVPSTLKNVEGKNVLIIDDVTNTGNTLKYAKHEIMKFRPKQCLTSALLWDGDETSLCFADIISRYSPYWVVFPWEVVNNQKEYNGEKVNSKDFVVQNND